MIKSADDLNEQKRESDVLITAIEKCQKLEKQLKIAVDILEVISTHTCFCDEDIKEQVSIVYAWSSEALEQIEELNNHG
jgi:hypothetical protein